MVSELMLQQTVVATVVPYFHRFVRRFPDFTTLADAPLDEVLAHWSGLGYYARARNLHRAARAVVDTHAGRLPADEVGLRALPGVGEYTAAAVAAIAHGARTFALDGNAARVMARLFGEERPIDERPVRVALRAQGLTLVPASRPGDFAQAVMELGARVCVAGVPRCAACPLSRFCRARAEGRAEILPARSPRRAKIKMAIACLAVERGGQVLLVRRPPGGLLAGTWALPSAEIAEGETERDAGKRVLAEVGLEVVGKVERAGEVRHIFTHRDLTASVLRVRARGRGAPRGEAEGRWVVAEEPGALALSSFARKTLALLA
jgi:A/G-specific adenine glycosylase